MGEVETLVRIVENGRGSVAQRALVIEELGDIAGRGSKSAYDSLADIAADGHQPEMLRETARHCLIEQRQSRQ
jgi:hypothetical protein